MTDRDAMLATIQSNPDDDLPRLVYADWLEENGNTDRSYLIRWQCERGTRYTRTADSGWMYADRKTPPTVWRALNGFLGEPIPKPFTVERGFISAVTCPFADWVQNAEAVLPESAGLTVTLTTRPSSDWAKSKLLMLAVSEEVNRMIGSGEASAFSDAIPRAVWPGVKFVLPADNFLTRPLGGNLTNAVRFARDILASRGDE